MNPIARKSGLVVEFAGTDTLVYDKQRDVAHSLNPVTGYVFRNADGTRSIEELASELATALEMQADSALVSAALWELHRVNLLEGDAFVFHDAAKAEVSRREAIKRFGVAALAVVAVTTIAAPTPAMARSFGGTRGPRGPRPPRPNPRGGPGNNPNLKKIADQIRDALSKFFSRFGR